jgi:hypothetical protein
LAFGNTAHRWVAAHGAYGGKVHRDKEYFVSEGCSGVGRFIAGVSCAYNDDIIMVEHGRCSTWNVWLLKMSFY